METIELCEILENEKWCIINKYTNEIFSGPFPNAGLAFGSIHHLNYSERDTYVAIRMVDLQK